MIAPKGYLNFGNSCFFNSAMQALLSLDFFRNNIGDKDLFKGISLKDFAMTLPWYKPGIQDCAHDTLLRLIETFKLEKFFITEYEKVKVCVCGVHNLGKDIVINHLTSSIENISKSEEIMTNCECGSPTFKLISRLSLAHNAIIFSLNKFNQQLPESILLKTTSDRYIRYNLKCVIYHYGTPLGGHYFVKTIRGKGPQKVVYDVDDHNVRIESNKIFDMNNAHVALYEYDV